MTSASRRTLLAAVLVTSAAVFSAARAADAPEAAKSAIRAALAFEDGRDMFILSGPGSHFHVVLTNVSDKPVRLWREWCSWGYFNLTFRITADGEEFVAKRQGRDWTKNFADFAELAPGKSFVIDVHPQGGWQDFPLPAAGKEMRLTLVAVYENKSDDDAKRSGVWTGRVESDPVTITVLNRVEVPATPK